MTEDSRTLEQRIADVAKLRYTSVGGQLRTREILEAAGLPDLLAERDALLERAEKVKKDAEAWQRIQSATEADRDAALERAEKAEAYENEVGVQPAWAAVARAEAERDALREAHRAVLGELAASRVIRDALEAECDAAQAAAERAQKRIRDAANLFGVPDGGQYWNDWVETKRVRYPDSGFLEEGS